MKQCLFFVCLAISMSSAFGQAFPVVFDVRDKKTQKVLSNAHVTVEQLGWETNNTDANGKVQFSSVPVGRINYMVTHEGYLGTKGQFNVTPESKSNNVSVLLLSQRFAKSQLIVMGEVTDAAGEDVGGASVELKIATSILNATTDESGNYSFEVDLEALPDGVTEYNLEVKKGKNRSKTSGALPRSGIVKKDIKLTSEAGPLGAASCEGTNRAGVHFKINQCKVVGDKVICDFNVSNKRKDESDAEFVFQCRNATGITENGTQLPGIEMVIGNARSFSLIGNADTYRALYNTNVKGFVALETTNSNVKTLQVFEMKDQGLRCYNVPIARN